MKIFWGNRKVGTKIYFILPFTIPIGILEYIYGKTKQSKRIGTRTKGLTMAKRNDPVLPTLILAIREAASTKRNQRVLGFLADLLCIATREDVEREYISIADMEELKAHVTRATFMVIYEWVRDEFGFEKD